MMRELMEEYERWGLILNTQKTKYLHIGTETENLLLEDNKEMETCKEYEYLEIT